MDDNSSWIWSRLLYHPSNWPRMELHVGRKIFGNFCSRFDQSNFWVGFIRENILKAHQTHHSSEYYNLSTALRQSMWHKYFTFPTYLPLALIGIPPSQMLLHREMNLLYQFWVHTTQVPKLWVSYTYMLHVYKPIGHFYIDSFGANFTIVSM